MRRWAHGIGDQAFPQPQVDLLGRHSLFCSSKSFCAITPRLLSGGRRLSQLVLDVAHAPVHALLRGQRARACPSAPCGRLSSTRIRSDCTDGGDAVADEETWCPWRRECSASRMAASVSASTAERESSKIRTGRYPAAACGRWPRAASARRKASRRARRPRCRSPRRSSRSRHVREAVRAAA